MKNPPPSFWRRNTHLIPWLLWALLLAYTIGYAATHPGKHTVTPAYWTAAKAWLKGRDLYDGSGRGFIYFPQSAILQTPFALLPFGVAEIVWRLIQISLFSFSCYLSSGFFKTKNRYHVFLIITLISIPLSFSAARNGQANIAVISMMLMMVHFILKNHWWAAVSISAIGLCLKPFMIVPICLFSGLFPKRFLLRAIPFLLLVAVLPFLTQHPEYAVKQIKGCLLSLKTTAAIGRSVDYAYLFSMLRIFGLSLSGATETVLTLLAALFCFVYCRFIAKKSHALGVISAMGASAVFILLFNSRTEHNTYALIGPFFGVFAQRTWNAAPAAPIAFRALLVISYISILGSYEIGKFITPDHPVWMAPFGALIVSVLALFALSKKALENDP